MEHCSTSLSRRVAGTESCLECFEKSFALKPSADLKQLFSVFLEKVYRPLLSDLAAANQHDDNVHGDVIERLKAQRAQVKVPDAKADISARLDKMNVL